MTETDNPEVKEHLGTDPKASGQLIKRIEELDDNTREFQKMFESREIKPTVEIAKYNKLTQKYDLAQGYLDLLVQTRSTDATSAAATTWTVTTGKKWIIYYIGLKNATRNYGCTLSVGGTSIFSTSTTAFSNATYTYILGNTTIIAMGCVPLVVAAGTAIVLTDNAFQAGDTMSKTIIYREVDA